MSRPTRTACLSWLTWISTFSAACAAASPRSDIAAGQHARRHRAARPPARRRRCWWRARHRRRVGREHEGVDRERHPAADQHIEQPYLGRRGQRRDEDRRYGRLGDEQLAASEDDRGQHREHHQQADLGQPGSDRPYQQVGEHDSEHHPGDQLHRSLPALPERRAQRDHGRDRRERRPMLDSQQRRAVPRPDCGHTRLQNRPQMAVNASTRQWDEPLHARNNPPLRNRYTPRKLFTGR